MGAGFAIRPIGANAVEVSDLDIAAVADPAVSRQLYDLWMRRPIIHFPEIGIDPEAHIRLSAVFGRPDPHAIAAIRHPQHERLIRLSYDAHDPADEGAAHTASYFIDGRPAPGWLPWHKDGFFTQSPNHGSMLNPVRIAYAGGETAFVDTARIHASLPDTLKQRIADLEIVFDPLSTDPPVAYGAIGAIGIRMDDRVRVVGDHARGGRKSRIAQKLVQRHPLSGVTILNLTSLFGPTIPGMARDESDALLRDLLTICDDPQHVYTHGWRKGDLLLWDNWRCLHSVNPHPADASREMHRSTINVDVDVAMGRIIEG